MTFLTSPSSRVLPAFFVSITSPQLVGIVKVLGRMCGQFIYMINLLLIDGTGLTGGLTNSSFLQLANAIKNAAAKKIFFIMVGLMV